MRIGRQVPRGDGTLLRPGKIPIEVLEETVLRLTGKDSKSVVNPNNEDLELPPINKNKRYMLVSADPITGVTRDIGEYAINVSANDVATSGNRPQFAEAVVLLPEGSGRRSVGAVAEQMDSAAKRLGIAIVGGHTEVTPSLRRPIVMVTAFSFAKDYVTSGDAREGDTIMMTKTAGLEGSAVLANSGSLKGEVENKTVQRASRFLSEISVVEEAVAAYRTGLVSAMHDCTEGGVLGAVYEMSRASELGFRLEERAVPVAPETKTICSHLRLDPLKLIASGSMLLSVKAGKENEVRSALKGILVTKIGRFVRNERTLVRGVGVENVVTSAPEDELWRALRGAP